MALHPAGSARQAVTKLSYVETDVEAWPLDS